MKIIWSQFAEKQLDIIFDYFVENVSLEKASELIMVCLKICKLLNFKSLK